MQTQTISNDPAPDTRLFIKMVVDAWNTYNARFNQLLDSLSDEQLFAETAPGRNRGVYLAGHLVAVSDGMLPLLGAGEKLYPGYEEIFLKSPDRAVAELPSIDEIKKSRDDVNARLASFIEQQEPRQWFEKHAAVSEDDFAREPHRNKLNLFINRTNHLSYHLGQLVYLLSKK